ncbi:MAG: hypothetical protein LAP38_08210 [Acidobacteriia bacterium]|nr:hypothetical protein [Terriglobia bacterium]
MTGVLNIADFSTNICPGAAASIFGSNFGSSASAVTVTVGTKTGYVLAATPGQINVQIPFEVSDGATTLTVKVASATSSAFNLTLKKYSPAFFTQGGAGTGPANVFNAQGNALIKESAPAKPGDNLFTYLTGLGPTTPATATGLVTALAKAATAATLTIGGADANVAFAGVTPQTVGVYQVNFTVPTGAQGTQPLVLTVGGVSSTAAVTLPLIGVTTLVNNGSFASDGTAAPGSFVSIKGNALATTDQLTGFPDTKFQGVQVTFNGKPAPLFHLLSSTTPQQIDLLVPNELPTSGTVDVQVTTPTTFYPNYKLNMVPADPGIYRLSDPSNAKRSNVIAQFNATVWLAMPASTATALKLPGNCHKSGVNALSLCGEPATIGDYLVLYVTGLGKTTPNGDPNGTPLATGQVPPVDGSVLYKTVVTPTVTVGGVPVTLLYSGLPPGLIGEYQIVFQVPSGVPSGDDVPVVVTMGNRSDTATISIQPRP